MSPDLPKDPRALNAYPSTRDFMQYLEYIIYDHKAPIALDIETTSDSHIDIIGIADSPVHALSYNLFTGHKNPRLSSQEEAKFWYLISKALQRREVIMQNGMYDAAVLMHHNQIFASGFKYDTMIAAHACWPESKRSLAFLSSICLNVPKWKHESMSAPTMYNASDVCNTYGVWNVLEKEMDKLNVRHTFDFEMLQVWPAMMMQIQGLEVNKDKQEELLKSINQRLVELEVEIKNDLGGKEVNFNSPKQLQTLLYIDMKLPIQYKRRKSRYDDRKMTADAEALKKLSRISKNPIFAKIMEWKKLDKLTKFIDIDVSPQGRIHTSYNVTGATMVRKKKGLVIDDEDSYKSFGRWSSSKSIILPYGSGNLQNIPKVARQIYKAPPGYVFLQADYIQAEAVVVAYVIRDEVLIQMFKQSFGMSREERKANHFDVHLMTAGQMFRLEYDDITPEVRRIGKVIRHASNYSAGPGVVMNQLDCAMKEAKDAIQQFHNACPQLRLWHKDIQKELNRTRTLVNLLGRKHKFTDRWGDSLFRSAYSYIPQSTVGDLLNTGLVRLYNRYGSEMHIVLQLHDAIYCLVKATDSEVARSMERMKECMLMPLRAEGEEFIIDVDFAVGPSWGEMEEI
jgi:DNA polymerase-1